MAGILNVEQRGEVAVVAIDRPPANAIDRELLADGRALLDELRAAEPGAVVITGRPGFFSAGVDLKLAPTLDPDGQREMVDGINRVFLGWYEFPRPVVAAVNGHAVAGGLILALSADRRIGNGEGKLGLTELRAGIPYPAAAIAIVKAELAPPARGCWRSRRTWSTRRAASSSGCSTRSCRPTRCSTGRWRWPRGWPRCRARPTRA